MTHIITKHPLGNNSPPQAHNYLLRQTLCAADDPPQTARRPLICACERLNAAKCCCAVAVRSQDRRPGRMATPSECIRASRATLAVDRGSALYTRVTVNGSRGSCTLHKPWTSARLRTGRLSFHLMCKCACILPTSVRMATRRRALCPRHGRLTGTELKCGAIFHSARPPACWVDHL